MVKIKRDNSSPWRERWFVDEKQGNSWTNLFNSDSKTECLDFMRDYRRDHQNENRR